MLFISHSSRGRYIGCWSENPGAGQGSTTLKATSAAVRLEELAFLKHGFIMTGWNIIKRLEAKAEKHRNTKDCVFENDEIEEGTLYETLRDAAGLIRHYSTRLAHERSVVEDLVGIMQDLLKTGDIPTAVLLNHEDRIRWLLAYGCDDDDDVDEAEINTWLTSKSDRQAAAAASLVGLEVPDCFPTPAELAAHGEDYEIPLDSPGQQKSEADGS